jgi:hypothetical protein
MYVLCKAVLAYNARVVVVNAAAVVGLAPDVLPNHFQIKMTHKR